MVERIAIKDHVREVAVFTSRVTTAFGIVLLLLAVLIARLAYLQIVSHEHFTTLSENNRVGIVPELPTRGLIYDRNGVLLAENMPAYTLVLVPERVPDMAFILEQLADIMPISEAELARFNKQLKSTRRFKPVTLRYHLSEEEVARFAVNRHRFPGVDIAAQLLRHYPLGEQAVHALGYVGRVSEEDLQGREGYKYENREYIGKTGIEKYYESLLRGEEGVQQVETNAQGRILRVLERTPPVPGKDLYLSLDMRLQAIAEQALGEENGAVVAIDPNSGEVLVFASRPGYDPNLFVTGIDSKRYSMLRDSKDQPLFNRALRGRYPPGSTIKPFVGLAALEGGLRHSDHQVYCHGSFSLPGGERKYRDWKKEGHGLTDLNKAIVESCDVYFYELGSEIGIDILHDYLAQFGFGKLSGIDIFGESEGLFPSSRWKRKAIGEPWYLGETLIASIGQGYSLATPLQLAYATGVLARHGISMRPRLLDQVMDPLSSSIEKILPEPGETVPVINPQSWTEVIEAMRSVMHGIRGTARTAGRGLEYQMAGKTGTAQVFGIKQDEEYDAETLAKRLRDHALFVGFAPVDSPRIAIAVIVENGGGGGSVAAPIARQVIDAYMKGAS